MLKTYVTNSTTYAYFFSDEDEETIRNYAEENNCSLESAVYELLDSNDIFPADGEIVDESLEEVNYVRNE